MSNTSPDRKQTKLTDGNIVLRPYGKRDANALYEAVRESVKELGPWLPFAHQNYSLKESKDWIKKRPKEWKNGTVYDFAIVDSKNGYLLGGCGLNELKTMHRYANLGYWVRTSRTGRSVAPTATILLARWGFDVLKLTRVEILVAAGNTRSVRVAEKVGAKREGVLRNRLDINDTLHDAVMFSLIPEDLKK